MLVAAASGGGRDPRGAAGRVPARRRAALGGAADPRAGTCATPPTPSRGWRCGAMTARGARLGWGAMAGIVDPLGRPRRWPAPLTTGRGTALRAASRAPDLERLALVRVDGSLPGAGRPSATSIPSPRVTGRDDRPAPGTSAAASTLRSPPAAASMGPRELHDDRPHLRPVGPGAHGGRRAARRPPRPPGPASARRRPPPSRRPRSRRTRSGSGSCGGRSARGGRRRAR